jgi:hypothetical protein
MDTAADQLKKLREQVLEQIIPLLDNANIPIRDRFTLISQMARAKKSPELYEKAFHIAEGMDNDIKLNAYLDLIAAIDGSIQQRTQVAADISASDGNNPQAQNPGGQGSNQSQ